MTNTRLPLRCFRLHRCIHFYANILLNWLSSKKGTAITGDGFRWMNEPFVVPFVFFANHEHFWRSKWNRDYQSWALFVRSKYFQRYSRRRYTYFVVYISIARWRNWEGITIKSRNTVWSVIVLRLYRHFFTPAIFALWSRAYTTHNAAYSNNLFPSPYTTWQYEPLAAVEPIVTRNG